MTSETLKFLKLVIYFHKADSLSMFWKHFRDPKMSTLGRETLFIKSSDITSGPIHCNQTYQSFNQETIKLSTDQKGHWEFIKLSKHGMNKLSSIWVKYWSDNKRSTNQLTHVGKPFAPNPHPSLKIFFKGDPINPVFDFTTYRLKTIHIGKQFTPTSILLSKSFS